MIREDLRNNPLQTRDDLARALEDLIEPLHERLRPSCAQIELRSTGAHYQDASVGIEGFARALYGTVPYIIGDFSQAEHYRKVLITGLKNGSDPDHADQWGDPFFFRQNFIELGTISLMFLLMADRLDDLDETIRQNLAGCLAYIDTFDDVKIGNQQFFKLFTLLALQKLDPGRAKTGAIEQTLSDIDRAYLGDGWYNDGPAGDDNRSVDYYNAMAFHFYGLIFSKLQHDDFSEWSKKFRQRAQMFAPAFACWFDHDGRAIPFGRSLTYRMAQSGFWAALAFSGEEALPWSQVKSLALGNLRHWFSLPIFSEAGLLDAGYGYPNLNMAEEYNSPTSSYWALKPFLLLALPEDHVFWSVREQPVHSSKLVSVQRHGRHMFCRETGAGHLVLLNGGHWRKSRFQHIEEKCAKFAYSTHFGFNVSTGNGGVDKRAPDNTLLLSDDGYYFKERGQTFDHADGEGYLASSFSPWPDVEIRTWLCPTGPGGHLRIHRIRSQREFTCIEGGFPIPRTDAYYPSMAHEKPDQYFEAVDEVCGAGQAMICYGPGMSGLVDPLGRGQGSIVLHAPNANVLHPRAVIPVIERKIEKGETFMVSLVLAHPDPVQGTAIWTARPGRGRLAGLVPAGLRDILVAAFGSQARAGS